MNFFSDDLLQEYVQEQLTVFGGKIKKNKGQWQLRCPICGDSKKDIRKMRGMYYVKTNSFHCFNEGCNASGFYLLTYILGQNIDQIKKDFIGWAKRHKIKQPIIQKEPSKIIEEKKEEFVLPYYWLSDAEELIDFISKRHIDKAPFLPKNFKLWYDIHDKRIIIPWSRIGNEIKCWQGRAIDNRQPKYKFSSGGIKDVFNIDQIDPAFPYIFLLEGALDAIWVKNGIAIGGLKPKDEQLQMIRDYWPMHTIVLMPDNQNTDEAAKKASEKAIMNNIKQKVFIWPKELKAKDVNDFIMNNDNLFTNEQFLIDNCSSGATALIKLKK